MPGDRAPEEEEPVPLMVMPWNPERELIVDARASGASIPLTVDETATLSAALPRNRGPRRRSSGLSR